MFGVGSSGRMTFEQVLRGKWEISVQRWERRKLG